MDKERIKEFVFYFLKFLPLAAIGTIAHEFGHFFAALIQGHWSIISYGFTTLLIDFATYFQYLIFILGGPISTWATCFIGFSLLIFKYRKNLEDPTYKMSSGHQISLFTTLFCSRAVFNTLGWMVGRYFQGREMGTSDEEKISLYFGWAPEILLFGGMILGIIIILLCVIYFIPKSQRSVILISGIAGALIGYVIWYYLLGPVIMPVP